MRRVYLYAAEGEKLRARIYGEAMEFTELGPGGGFRYDEFVATAELSLHDGFDFVLDHPLPI